MRSRFRRDYDQQSFAFDLARLYRAGAEETRTKAGKTTINQLGRETFSEEIPSLEEFSGV